MWPEPVACTGIGRTPRSTGTPNKRWESANGQDIRHCDRFPRGNRARCGNPRSDAPRHRRRCHDSRRHEHRSGEHGAGHCGAGPLLQRPLLLAPAPSPSRRQAPAQTSSAPAWPSCASCPGGIAMDPSTNPVTTPPTAAMQFAGIPLDDLRSLALFIACLAAALGLVYLFCQKKFGEPSSSGSDDLVDQMLPRYLATREEYSKGFLTYFATMAATVLLLSLIGPKDLAALGVPLPKELSSVAIPLAAALLLTGVMPNVPVLLDIEKWVRKYAHERAYIPAAARATAQRL